MKHLRCFAIVLVCLVVLFAEFPAKATAVEMTAKEDHAEIPAEMKTFAEETILPFIKGWLKSSGKVGKYFETKEEIDALQIGSIYKCYYFDRGDFSEVTMLSEAIHAPGEWMVLICSPGGEAKWYVIITEADSKAGYAYATEGCAVGLGQALKVFENINSAKGLNVVPKVIHYAHQKIVMEVIDGKEYVITAGNTLDNSYIGVTDPKYLPTGTEIVTALRDANSKYADAEEGEVFFGDSGAIWLTASEQPQSKPALETWHILLMVGGICLATIAAAGLVIVRRRKEKQ